MTQVQYRVLRVSDSDDWNRVLPAYRSIFGSHTFMSIAAAHNRYEPQLLVVEDGSGIIAYPYFLRPTNTLEFASGIVAFDSMTPEFTGPVVTGFASADLRRSFKAAIEAEVQQHCIVSEFAHLHPWADQDGMLDVSLTTYDREIVWIDVSLGKDVLWREHFSHACRKNINRSQRENVRVFEAETEDHIREFHRIYLHTMNRNNARSSYYFGLDYFLSIFRKLGSNARFVLAEHDGRIIASVLYLHDAHDVYSYLGGADADSQEARPSNAVIFDTINWARECRKKRFILGGGYRPDDGIFRFKSSFSRNLVKFYTYRRIHLSETYAELERLWKVRYGDASASRHFPPYRLFPDQAQQSNRPVLTEGNNDSAQSC
jgi:hypothetical protein